MAPLLTLTDQRSAAMLHKVLGSSSSTVGSCVNLSVDCYFILIFSPQVSNWERPVPDGPVYFDAPPAWNEWGVQGHAAVHLRQLPCAAKCKLSFGVQHLRQAVH